MVEVVAADEFAEWLGTLEPGELASVEVSVRRLQQAGIALGFPHSSALEGSRHALRELRPKQGKSPLRVFYAFDPKRRAVLLLGGSKAADKRLYQRLIPQADAIFERYAK